MSVMPPVPHKIAMIDQMGAPTPVWSDFFKQLLTRIGGPLASTNTEIEARFPVATIDIGDAQVTADKIASAVAGSGLAGGAGSALSVNVDGTTIEIASDTLRNKDNGISFVKLLSTDWTSSKASSGYQKLASGLYVQWGVTGSLSSASTTSVTLPTAFPTACLQVLIGIQGNSASSTVATGHYGSGNYSTTAFDLYNRTSLAFTFNYFAVGY
jgi:hypothetical protein